MRINSASYFVLALLNPLCSFWKTFLVLSFHVVRTLPSSAGSVDNIDNNNNIGNTDNICDTSISSLFYRAMYYSAKHVLRLHVVCLSVCPSVCNVGGSPASRYTIIYRRFEILETNCTHNWHNTFALRSLKPIHLVPGEHG